MLETQAQGHVNWLPYPGQLRLQAYSHLAQGANCVEYWHWHSIHNSVETYWRGLLSQDFAENDTYLEACRIGRELAAKGDHLVNLKKKNEVAILASNLSLTALKYFPIEAPVHVPGTTYNDILRRLHDALFDMNVECDIIWPESQDYDRYKVIIVPALYASSEETLSRLNRYVENGGHILATFKSGVSDAHNKVYSDTLPHILSESLGVVYHQFTLPQSVKLTGEIISGDHDALVFMELLIPQGAQVLASYDHPAWKKYAAVTKNHYGKGTATYLGTMPDEDLLKTILRGVLADAGVDLSNERAGAAVRTGVNDYGRTVRYYLNYSAEDKMIEPRAGTDLLTGEPVFQGDQIEIEPWGVRIIEENQLIG